MECWEDKSTFVLNTLVESLFHKFNNQKVYFTNFRKLEKKRGLKIYEIAMHEYYKYSCTWNEGHTEPIKIIAKFVGSQVFKTSVSFYRRKTYIVYIRQCLALREVSLSFSHLLKYKFTSKWNLKMYLKVNTKLRRWARDHLLNMREIRSMYKK